MFGGPEGDSHSEDADYNAMLLVYYRGFYARLEELPCTPPPSLDVAVGLDTVGIWTAGWEEADRELLVGG
jgi:hypothetical protein